MQTDDGYPDALPRGYHLHWYLLEQVLGQGGFGITYLARDTNLDQRVAIKEYLPVEVAARRNDASVRARTEEHDERYRGGLARFIREARTLARFDHPNIVRVLSVFEFNNTAYMVMRFEEGSNLAAVLEKRGTLREGDLMRIVQPILDGLELVHNAGFIHRDIKPDNIHIRADGSPVLLDFGSARQPISHAPSMTILVAPGYAPFEQYYSSGENQGPWTDIYALGATCYRAISGAAPLDAIARSKGVLGSAREMLVPASVVGAGKYSERLLKAIDHALEFEERKRPQSIADWRRELLPQPGTAQPQPVVQAAAVPLATRSGETPAKSVREGTRTAVVAGVVGAVVAIVGVALPLYFYPLVNGKDHQTQAPMPPKLPPVQITQNEPPVAPPDQSKASKALATAQDEQLQLKAQIEKLQKQIDEQHQREVEAARKQEEALKQGEARKQEAAKKVAVARQQKLAQQLAEARKRQAEEEQKKLAAEREAKKQASSTQTQVATAAPVVAPVPPGPAQQLKKAESDYAAGKHADALPVFKQQAEGGNAEAQLDLGKAYAEGRGVKRDDASAAMWYRRAAMQGNAEAQLRLGALYAEGHGVPADDFQAYVWFSAAARGGNTTAKARQEQAAKLLQPVEIEQAGKLVASLPLLSRTK
ncbi:MAG TPA: protein kinase [Burkholderiales bacterium]|nr:protein kinase [Burkholderiales bacterium]